MQAAARSLGLQLAVLEASTQSQIDAAFAGLVRHKVDALLINTDPFLLGQREQIVQLAARTNVPVIYFLSDFVDAGGLMSYGPKVTNSYRQVGIYVGRILPIEKARVNHAHRRHGGGLAARGARTAAGETPDHRILGRDHGFGRWPKACSVRAATPRARLDREPRCRDRSALGRRAQRALRRNCRRVRPAQGRRHSHPQYSARSRRKAGDIHHPDRVRVGGRSRGHRHGHVIGSTGRQRHRSVEPADRCDRQAARATA